MSSKNIGISLSGHYLYSMKCQKTLHQVLEGGLSALGTFCHMHWDIVHTLLEFQRLAIASLYTTHGISHMEALVDPPPMERIMWSLVTYSVEDLKLEIGLLGPFQ